MQYEIRFIVEADASPRQLVSETTSNFEFVGIADVLAASVTYDGNLVYSYERDRHDGQDHTKRQGQPARKTGGR